MPVPCLRIQYIKLNPLGRQAPAGSKDHFDHEVRKQREAVVRAQKREETRREHSFSSGTNHFFVKKNAEATRPCTVTTGTRNSSRRRPLIGTKLSRPIFTGVMLEAKKREAEEFNAWLSVSSGSSSSGSSDSSSERSHSSSTSASENTKEGRYWNELRAPFLSWRAKEVRKLAGSPDVPEELLLDPKKQAWEVMARGFLREQKAAQALEAEVAKLSNDRWRFYHRARASACIAELAAI